MADLNKIANVFLDLTKVAILPGVKLADDLINQRKENKVRVPNLNKKGFPISVDDAEKRLKKSGLEICKIPLTIQQAESKYRNCRVNEVISSSEKQGTLVDVGYTIDVRYIPEEVIRESQRIFEASELKKQDRKDHVKKTFKRGADKITPKKRSSKTK
ncbi:MAG: hypothetical protein E7K64_04475 [Clostridia bacterium]|nr:hypothetical protein [Clostridiales bacterium]MDU7505281.1 hypothetical protein [Clostridia bacterium]